MRPSHRDTGGSPLSYGGRAGSLTQLGTTKSFVPVWQNPSHLVCTSLKSTRLRNYQGCWILVVMDFDDDLSMTRISKKSWKYGFNDRLESSKAERQTDRQTDRQTGTKVDNQAHRQKEIQI